MAGVIEQMSNLETIMNHPVHSGHVRLFIPFFDAVARCLPHGSPHRCLGVTFPRVADVTLLQTLCVNASQNDGQIPLSGRDNFSIGHLLVFDLTFLAGEKATDLGPEQCGTPNSRLRSVRCVIEYDIL